MSNTNELKFENVTVYKEDVEVLERVIQKHLDELMLDYKSEFHHDLVIAGLTRIMLTFGRRIVINPKSDGEGYLVQIIDEK